MTLALLAVVRQHEAPPARGELLGYVRTVAPANCFNIRGLREMMRKGYPRLRMKMVGDEGAR